MKLKVLTYNTLFAGRDGGEDKRAKLQVEIINGVRPDIFLMQEAKGFDANGRALLYELENKIEMRGFLAIAPRTGQNTAIFLRQPLRPITFEQDGANFHHALTKVSVALPNGESLLALSAHLCPYGPEVRRREACYLTSYPSPMGLSLLTGDFNSMSPHDPEPADLAALSLRDRSRYVADYMRTPDHSVLTRLEHAGWVDVGKSQQGNGVPTVPAAGFKDTEFPTMRCDYIMASDALARRAISYEVIRTPQADMASDHYPVTATFRLEGQT